MTFKVQINPFSNPLNRRFVVQSKAENAERDFKAHGSGFVLTTQEENIIELDSAAKAEFTKAIKIDESIKSVLLNQFSIRIKQPVIKAEPIQAPIISKGITLALNKLPTLREIWKEQVLFHLRLYKFMSELTQVSLSEGNTEILDHNALNRIACPLNFDTNDKILKYQVGFITANLELFINRSNTQNNYYLGYLFMKNLTLLLAMRFSHTSNFFKKLSETFPNSSLLRFSSFLNPSKLELFWIVKPFQQKVKMQGLEKGTNDYAYHSYNWIHSLTNLAKRVLDFSLSSALESSLLYLLRDVYPSGRIPFHEITERLLERSKKTNTQGTMTVLVNGYKAELDERFLSNPSEYLKTCSSFQSEQGPFLGKGHVGHPYVGYNLKRLIIPMEHEDKIKIVPLKNGQRLYCKRLNPLRVRYPEEEVEISEKAREVLQAINPNWSTQEFVGFVYDGKGSFYLLSKEVPYTSKLSSKSESSVAKEIQQALRQVKEIPDPDGYCRLKDCLVHNENGTRKITVIDFETLPKIEELRELYSVKS